MASHRCLAWAPLWGVVLVLGSPAVGQAAGPDLPRVTQVERQPLVAQVKRVSDALELLGAPLPAADREALETAFADKDDAKAVTAIQEILDKHCLAGVRITPAGGSQPPLPIVDVRIGAAKPELAEQGWRVFLVKVDNPTGFKDLELRPDSPNARAMVRPSFRADPAPKVESAGEIKKRFLELAMFNTQPLVRDLSGLELEYRILQIYSRDAGRREAELGFGLWKGARPQQVARSNLVTVDCECVPAVLVRLRVHDFDGKPTTGSFIFRDARGRVYPAQTRRLAPDFFFHAQIYRADGETVSLQPGKYTVTYTRGPEYRVLSKEITIPATATHSESFELQRWIHPAAQGYYSGDHHVHAAGCSHYESPTEGVTPEDMMRHVLGEDLNVGCCLSWGPCWYHQKRYFEGKVNPLSRPDYLLRYDVEVSGFPSSHCGHICLLRLREEDYRYPDGRVAKVIEDWPSWDLPIFLWAKKQGAVVGFAHSGWGLAVKSTELPNYDIPPMDGIGANEYLVDLPHGACDFISTVDTPAPWELNIWYHTLNCGYRARISGETDFPCIYGERVGLGRSYVHLGGKLNFDDWAEGIKKGRSYVSDGKSHLLDFRVNGTEAGTHESEVKLAGPGRVSVSARVAALLEPKPSEATERIRRSPLSAKPYWDIERARIGDSRKVPVEVIVNGRAVDRKEIVADGTEQDVTFEIPVRQSSWVCLRILPSSHTNPVFVLVDDKSIRASRRSVEWCLKAIDVCWNQKVRNIHPEERPAARAAYDKARSEYGKILAECAAD
jgi:hypothetical protein